VARAPDTVPHCAQVYIGIVLLIAAGQTLGWEGGLDPDCVRFLALRGLSPPAMDLDAVERTKRHYDAHAKAPVGSRKDAMRQRAQVCQPTVHTLQL